MSVNLSRRDEFAILTIDRVEALNALSFSLIEELDQCLDRVEASDARALLLVGAGSKAFCAGADVLELIDLPVELHRERVDRGQQVFSRLEALPIVSVAIVNGYAFGGGLELALCCTFRIGTMQAQVGLPEVKLGLIPGYGGTQRLPRVIGETRAMEMILSGRTMASEEALQTGLFSRLVEGNPIDSGMTFARSFTKHSLATLQIARSAVRQALASPLQEGLVVEADLASSAYRTADASEGMRAFVAKQRANFKDR